MLPRRRSIPKTLMEACDLTQSGDVGSLFYYLSQSFHGTTDMFDDVSQLTDLYYYIRSGDKPITPYVERMIGLYDPPDNWRPETLAPQALGRIALTIGVRFLPNWMKEYATRSMEYDPIENYSMEEVTDGSERVITDKTSRSANMETESSSDAESRNYGFNPPTGGNPRDSATSGSTVTTTGDPEDNYEESIHSESGTLKLTRHGNIGVTTSQQMIQSERDLWKWDFYNDVMFPDLDKILTLAIY